MEALSQRQFKACRSREARSEMHPQTSWQTPTLISTTLWHPPTRLLTMSSVFVTRTLLSEAFVMARSQLARRAKSEPEIRTTHSHCTRQRTWQPTFFTHHSSSSVLPTLFAYDTTPLSPDPCMLGRRCRRVACCLNCNDRHQTA